MTEAPPPIAAAVSQSFLNRALDSVHPIVMSFIGAVMGVTIALIAILQLGGMAVPVNNYLTAQLSPQVRSLETSITELRGIIVRIEALENARLAMEHRVVRTETELKEVEKRLLRVERRVGIPQ